MSIISISFFLHLRKKMKSPVFINMRFEYVMKLAYAGWGLPVSIILYPTHYSNPIPL